MWSGLDKLTHGAKHAFDVCKNAWTNHLGGLSAHLSILPSIRWGAQLGH